MAKRRPSGDGMVRKREDGRWEGRIVIGHKENGDSIFRYIYADTQKELTAKLRQNINAYQGVDLTEESKMTLSQWLDKWLDTYMTGTVRESTLDGYRRDLNNHVKPYLGEKPLLKITPADLSELYQALLERGRVVRKKASGFGLSPTTVHGIHTTLHHALRTAAEEGLLPANPADGATPPKVVNRAKGILNNAQLDTFKAAIQKDWIWRDFFLTELTTGLRRGELCGLKWSDFSILFFLFVCIPDLFKGVLTDGVFNPASISLCNFRVNASCDKLLCKELMPLINFFGNIPACFGQMQNVITIYR